MTEVRYSDDWMSMAEEEKLAIENVFREKGQMDLFEKYKYMSISDMQEECFDNNFKIDKLKMKELVYQIVIHLKSTSILNFPIRDIDNYIKRNNLNMAIMDADLFSFQDKEVETFVSLFSLDRNKHTTYTMDCIYNRLIAPQRKKKNTLTYVMTDASRYVKIGKTICLKKREATLTIGNPTIKVIAILEEDIEKVLHKKFASKKVIGEWFNLTSDDIDNLIMEYNFTDKRRKWVIQNKQQLQ